jgi:hypothetical protein
MYVCGKASTVVSPWMRTVSRRLCSFLAWASLPP